MQKSGLGKVSPSPKAVGSQIVFHNSQNPPKKHETSAASRSSKKQHKDAKSEEYSSKKVNSLKPKKPNQKIGSQAIHPSLQKHLERQKRIENTLRNLTPKIGHSSVRKESQDSSRTPQSQKTLRKPGLRVLGSTGIPEKKIQKIIGKETNILNNYSLLGPEDKIEVQNKIIEILKRKLLQEQRLRLERESELDAILKKDTSTLLDLEEKLMHNDSELGLLLTDRRNSTEVIKQGFSQQIQKLPKGAEKTLETDGIFFQKFNEFDDVPDGVQTDRPRYSNVDEQFSRLGQKINQRAGNAAWRIKKKTTATRQDEFLQGLEYSYGSYADTINKGTRKTR